MESESEFEGVVFLWITHTTNYISITTHIRISVGVSIMVLPAAPMMLFVLPISCFVWILACEYSQTQIKPIFRLWVSRINPAFTIECPCGLLPSSIYTGIKAKTTSIIAGVGLGVVVDMCWLRSSSAWTHIYSMHLGTQDALPIRHLSTQFKYLQPVAIVTIDIAINIFIAKPVATGYSTGFVGILRLPAWRWSDGQQEYLRNIANDPLA